MEKPHIGYYVYDGVIVSKTSHDPIVTMDDFLFAYTRLSPIKLDGTLNENKPTVSRRFTTIPALCENILWYTSEDGSTNTCYVTKQGYRAHSSNTRQYDYRTSYTPIYMVDTAVSTAILGVLAALDMRHRQGLIDSLYYQIAGMLEEKASEQHTSAQSLENLDKAIKGWELDKQSCRETGNKQGLDEANRQLKRLYADRDALVEKIKATEKEQAILAETQSLHQQAIMQWYELSFERQQRFVLLLVQRVELTEVSPHILKITLTFKPPIGCTTTGYLWRVRGDKAARSDEELSTLRRLYPRADRLDILKALPKRTWRNIKCYGYKKGIKRLVDTRKAPFHNDCTYEDWQVIQRVQTTHPGFGLGKIHAAWEPFNATVVSDVSRKDAGVL